MLGRFCCAVGVSVLALAPFSAGHASTPLKRVAAKHRATTTCQVNPGANNSFVGIPGAGDVAGGAPVQGGGFTQYAGVAAGQGNQACSFDTGILAGQNNIVGSGDGIGNATDYSVVVGGSSNMVDALNDSLIGAGSSNLIQGGGAVGPSGPFSNSAILAGATNTVSYASDSIIGGGTGNKIAEAAVNGQVDTANSSLIGSGDDNSIAGGTDSVIAGGSSNSITGGTGSAIGGGLKNETQSRQDYIGGGYSNQITATSAGGSNGSALAVIAGGSFNSIASTALNAGYFGVIGGGTKNVVTGLEATIAGGYANSATGAGASVPGGSSNIAAGTDSFAAGTDSDAATAGSFVFSDDASGAKQLVASGANVFLVRASGGAAFYSNPGLTAGVVLHAGSGAWSNLSDRNAKTDFAALDPQRVLAKVAALPVDEWSYRTEGNVRHVGPMAQDFYAAFKVGEDNRHITTVDEDGVALAAIKALYADKVSLANAMKRKDREVATLRNAVDRLTARDAKLESDVAALEAKARILR